MKVSSKSVILAGAVLFLGTPAIAAVTSGLVGDCVDCHTMHNSQQNQPVAMVGTAISATPIQNLLRMDCIACHADPTRNVGIYDNGGGSKIPQVNQSGGTTQDLAGGSFAYLTQGNRKGHNVVDLGYGADSNGGGAVGLTPYGTPPGMYLGSGTHATATRFTMDGGFLKNFTCAGSAGCHGIRNQALSVDVNLNNTTNSAGNTGGTGPSYTENPVRRTGIAAVSGAHHNSYDGVKAPVQTGAAGAVDGQYMADSYRFIPGLKGAGNTTSDADRWANKTADSHNEYAGNNVDSVLPDSHGVMGTCGNCHANGTTAIFEAEHIYTDGYLKVPNQSMSGFCVTCHGEFHSTAQNGGLNGVSGAFLRHPSDYVLPSTGEYSSYTAYNLTAPVARPDLSDPTIVANTVRPGTDMVMCLSCHMAHASEYDYMLRFNYSQMQAGNATTTDGCLACHTTKGILPQNR